MPRVNLDTLARREKLRPGVDFINHFIYHIDPVRDEVVGFTAATRRGKFTETRLAGIGMGAICEFEVENMPVTVDAQGR